MSSPFTESCLFIRWSVKSYHVAVPPDCVYLALVHLESSGVQVTSLLRGVVPIHHYLFLFSSFPLLFPFKSPYLNLDFSRRSRIFLCLRRTLNLHLQYLGDPNLEDWGGGLRDNPIAELFNLINQLCFRWNLIYELFPTEYNPSQTLSFSGSLSMMRYLPTGKLRFNRSHDRFHDIAGSPLSPWRSLHSRFRRS